MGDLPKAERHYRLLLTEPEKGHIDSLDITMMGYKAHHNLATIYLDMNRLEEAHTEFQAALNENPEFLPSVVGLGEVYVRMRRFEDAREVVTRLGAIAPEEGEKLVARITRAMA